MSMRWKMGLITMSVPRMVRPGSFLLQFDRFLERLPLAVVIAYHLLDQTQHEQLKNLFYQASSSG